MATINIASEYTQTPGGRSKSDGSFSGEEFREMFLEKYFEEGNNEPIKIILDGTYGYATSFLEETFGGLARKFEKQSVLDRIEFVSEEEPLLIEEIKHYIENCE